MHSTFSYSVSDTLSLSLSFSLTEKTFTRSSFSLSTLSLCHPFSRLRLIQSKSHFDFDDDQLAQPFFLHGSARPFHHQHHFLPAFAYLTWSFWFFFSYKQTDQRLVYFRRVGRHQTVSATASVWLFGASIITRIVRFHPPFFDQLPLSSLVFFMHLPVEPDSTCRLTQWLTCDAFRGGKEAKLDQTERLKAASCHSIRDQAKRKEDGFAFLVTWKAK